LISYKAGKEKGVEDVLRDDLPNERRFLRLDSGRITSSKKSRWMLTRANATPH